MLNICLIKFNLYTKEESLSLSEQLLATRLNLFCLFSSLCILIIIRGLTFQIETNRIISPTLSQFDQFSEKYPLTLSCSCSQNSIPYKTFLSLTPIYHQLCSSDFISDEWISSLFNSNKTDYYPLDFRLSASSQFQIIKILCRITLQTVENIQMKLTYERMLNNYLLSRSYFQTQVKAYLEKIQIEAITNLLRIDKYFQLNIEYNRIVSSLRTNYFVYSVPGSRTYKTYTGHYLLMNYTNTDNDEDYCSCDDTYECIFQSGIYSQTLNDSAYYQPNPRPMYSVPGILVGCLPGFSIIQSSLECFYDRECLNTLQSFGIKTSSYRLLNTSIPSKFSINSTIKSMFNELFIEQWQEKNNFTDYFHACAPMVCSYTYKTRFRIIYIITSILGLLGGLTMTFNFLVVFFVKFIIRRIIRICCRHTTHDESDELQNNNRNFFHIIRQFLLTLNVFEQSILLFDMKQKIWATRIYIILLICSTLILIIYSSVNAHSQTVTIEKPTQNQFEILYKKYFLTLSCSCTQNSILYSNIMSIQPRFHQICSSDFIREDKWLQYFNLIRYNSLLIDYNFFSQDFRLNGYLMFRILKVLCEFANETVFNSLITFNNTQFISNNPLTIKHFNEQTSSLIDHFQKETLGSFLFLFTLVRTSMDNNNLHVSLDTNFAATSYNINNTWYVRLRPRTYPNETHGCLTNVESANQQGFYCRSIPCLQQGIMNQTIPGLVRSCFPISSLLLSTLECFFNQSCIQMLSDWRLFEMEDIFQPLNLSFISLNSSLLSRYFSKTKLAEIISQLLIEEWIVNSNSSVHYENCQPKICTYTYVTRFEIIYVITNIIGLFGGLSVVLRLLIPLCTKIVIQYLEKRRQIRIQSEQSVIVRFKESLSNIGIFYAQINNSIWATRIYFSLLFIIFVFTVIFVSLNEDIQSTTISLSSQLTFEQVYKQHYHTHSLSCPCRQNTISYKTFLSISVNYHQVCSSSFVSVNWWKLIVSREPNIYPFLDQSLLSNHFRSLSSLCQLAQNTINNVLNAFFDDIFISIETLTNEIFYEQIQSTLQILIEQILNSFSHTIDYFIDIFRSNQLEHLFLSNWVIDFTTANENYILAPHPLVYNNGTCICATSTSSTCFWPLNYQLFNQTTMTLPGFVGGCLPMDGLRLSTLQCLFDDDCLDRFRLIINNTITYSIPKTLNKSSNIRFPYLTTQIDTLIRELFVEEWMNMTNYSAYYEQCSPRACHYIFSEKNSIIYVITFLLGLYGGLTISIRFLVTYTFKIFICLYQSTFRE